MSNDLHGFISTLAAGRSGAESREYNAPPSERPVDLTPGKVLPKLNEQVVDYVPPHLLPAEFRGMYDGMPISNNMTAKIEKVADEDLGGGRIREGFLRNKKFRGIKDDYLGMVVAYDYTQLDEGMVFLVFINGERVNKELVYEYFTDAGSIPVTEVAQVAAPVVPVAPIQVNPIALILDSALPVKKIVDFKYEIGVPSTELHHILKASFQDADQKMVDYIISKISKDALYESFVSQLKEYLVQGYSLQLKVVEPIVPAEATESEDLKKKSNQSLLEINDNSEHPKIDPNDNLRSIEQKEASQEENTNS